MLSKTFKSAVELGLEEDLYEALVKVYWLLVDEKIPQALFIMEWVIGPRIDNDGEFCGTSGCLLGWCHAVAPKSGNRSWKWGSALHRLFYPRQLKTCDRQISWRSLTREQATVALHGYLTTGKDAWIEAVKGA